MRAMPRPAQQLDPYEVLEVSRGATLEEIRRSFKKLVLKAHPDKNPHRTQWSERRIRELFQAFEILRDSDRRREYDLELRARASGRRSPPTERDLFFFRKDDPESRALRILYFLLHRRGDEALSLLDEMEKEVGRDFLRARLDREDYLDCLFLLGEHLIKRRLYRQALDRFLALYRHERLVRYRRHYFDMVVDFLKTLYLRHLPRTLSPQDLIDALEEAVGALPWTRREHARLFLALARASQAVGDDDQVREYLEKASETDPQFQPVKRWLDEITDD